MGATLAYGLRNIPAGVATAWGARLIWPCDLVHDRQDLSGPNAATLQTWLNNGPLRQALATVPRLIDIGLRKDESREVVLYEDDDGIIKADPQSSHGYLYVAAWLKADEI